MATFREMRSVVLIEGFFATHASVIAISCARRVWPSLSWYTVSAQWKNPEVMELDMCFELRDDIGE